MAALSSISKALTILLLTSWTVTVLGFTALDVLNSNRSLVELIASTTLLTFLVCRLSVASQEANSNTASIAHLLSAGATRSRTSALTLLILTFSWLYELIYKTVILFFVTLFGSVIATAIYNDALVEVNPDGTPIKKDNIDPELDGASTAALSKIDDFVDQTGVDPTKVIKMIPPQLLVYAVALVWVDFASLGLYVLRLAWRAVKKVVGIETTTPAVSPAPIVVSGVDDKMTE